MQKKMTVTLHNPKQANKECYVGAILAAKILETKLSQSSRSQKLEGTVNLVSDLCL